MPLAKDVGCATCPSATLTMSMPPRFLEVEGNQTTGNTSIYGRTTGGTDRQTYRQTFFYGCFGAVGG